MQTLNISSDPSQRFNTTLGGQSVILEVYYQDASASWFLNLYLGDETPIIKGRRLFTNNDCLRHVYKDTFTGSIVPVSVVTPVEELNRTSWGTTHTLTYYPEGEFTAE